MSDMSYLFSRNRVGFPSKRLFEEPKRGQPRPAEPQKTLRKKEGSGQTLRSNQLCKKFLTGGQVKKEMLFYNNQVLLTLLRKIFFFMVIVVTFQIVIGGSQLLIIANMLLAFTVLRFPLGKSVGIQGINA